MKAIVLVSLFLASCVDVGDDEGESATCDMEAEVEAREERCLDRGYEETLECCPAAAEADCADGLLLVPLLVIADYVAECHRAYCAAYSAAGCPAMSADCG